jgi:hypothetical protein
MPTLLRNALAVIAGIVIGGVINGGLVRIGPSIIPTPPGIDVTNPESLAANIHLLQPKHYVFPFLAHALGTLAGALVAYLLSASHRARMAYVVGAFYLIGGIVASFLIPAPAWYIVLDLLAAYLPMAWLATAMGISMQRGGASPNREAGVPGV